MYWHLFQQTPDAVLIADDDARYVEANAAASALLGYSRDELLRMTVADVFLTGLAWTEQEYAAFLAVGHWRGELELRRKDGDVVTVEVVASIIRSPEQTLHAAVLREASARLRGQQAMEEAREAELQIAQDRARLAFAHAPIGMVLAEVNGRLREVNRVFCDMLGRTEDELLDLSVDDITQAQDVGDSRDLLTLLASGAIDSRQVFKRYRHADGHDVPAVVSVSVINGADGSPRFAVAQAQDITEQLHMRRALVEQQTFTAAVLENLDSGIVSCDDTGTLMMLNRVARQMLPDHETVAGPEAWSEHFGLYRPDGVSLLPMTELPLYQALQGDVVRDCELVIRARSGKARTVNVNGHAIYDGDGVRIGALVALHDITDRKGAEAALAYQALHDPVTDLANRVLLSDRLQHAQARQIRNPAPMSLFMLSLDEFDRIGDIHGYRVVDEVLGNVAARLHGCLRPADTIARVDGAEFAVLLEETLPEDALAIAAQVLDVVSEPIDIAGQPTTIQASIGVVSCGASDDVEQLLRRGDLARQAAMAQDEGKVRIFTSTMHDAATQQISLENDLRDAVDRGELAVHYQPIYSLITGRLDGFEALARWNHPRRGLIAPATFIPLAESTGIIVSLGEWVLRKACRQIRRWQQSHPDTGRLTMSVNLSVRQLLDPSTTQVVAGALADADLDPDQLMLEITESIVMHRGSARTTLGQLHSTGVRIAIDDFGTGYSSLSRLHSMPVDKVKIDKSFIDELRGGAAAPLVAATIIMAHSLGLQTIAEGVERAEQLPFLRLHGCDQAQGYLFGRPEPADVIGDRLAELAKRRLWTTSVDPGRAKQVRQ
ncbi:MAG: EAL domain-containing protein [Nocardioidaceae bacterium]|nr:EAL domain-containing protein [Nocardioidaceae bacterium]